MKKYIFILAGIMLPLGAALVRKIPIKAPKVQPQVKVPTSRPTTSTFGKKSTGIYCQPVLTSHITQPPHSRFYSQAQGLKTEFAPARAYSTGKQPSSQEKVKYISIKSWKTQEPSWFGKIKEKFFTQEVEKSLEAKSYRALFNFFDQQPIDPTVLNIPIYLPRSISQEIDERILSNLEKMIHQIPFSEKGYLSTNLTFLKLAILSNKLEFVKQFLAQGADPNFSPIKVDISFYDAQSTASPLMLAADQVIEKSGLSTTQTAFEIFKILAQNQQTDLNYEQVYKHSTLLEQLEIEKQKLTSQKTITEYGEQKVMTKLNYPVLKKIELINGIAKVLMSELEKRKQIKRPLEELD